MKQPYIGVLPGHIKDGDDTRTNLLTVLGMEDLAPMSIGDYNDGYHTPPVAAVEIDGEQYSLKAVLSKVNERITSATPDDTTVNGRAWTSKKTVDSLCMPLEATGNPVQVYPVEGYPLGVKVSWEPVQAGSGDPSPDNVRPITGRDNLSVTRCGANLIDLNQFNHGKVSNDTIISSVTGGNSAYTINDAAIPVAAGYHIRISADYSLGKGRVIVRSYDASGGIVKSISASGFSYSEYYGGHISNLPCTYIADEGVKTIKIGLIYMDYNAAAGEMATYSHVSAVIGSTDEPYEHHTGSTTDIALPETVYGGTLDLDTGVVTVERARKSLTGSENVATEAAWAVGAYKITGVLKDAIKVSGYNTKADLMCSHTGKVTTPDSIANNYSGDTHGIGQGADDVLFIRLGTDYDTVSKFADYLAEQNAAGTPVQICYKLADPYTIHLTPQQIAALSGVNTLYTDAGTLTVTGREDPRHTIVTLTDRIAALESAAAGV